MTATSTPTIVTMDSSPRTHPTTLDLPQDILEGIGKIIILWAFEEWFLTGVAADLMGIDRKRSREVMNGRADDALAMIKTTLAERKMEPPKLWMKIATQVSDLAERRNRVGHGVWATHRDTGELLLQRIAGEWEVDGKNIGVPRRRTPEGQRITPQWLADSAAEIHQCIADTQALNGELALLKG